MRIRHARKTTVAGSNREDGRWAVRLGRHRADRIPGLRSPRTQVAIALGLYLGFALWASWPLALDLGSRVYLYPTQPAPAGDLAGSIAHLRELVEGLHNPFVPGTISDFAAPEGLRVRWALNLASFSSTSVLYGLALVVGANAAYGLFALLGYVASGISMFLFARRLTGNAWVALVIGWAFAFYPFALVKGEHPHFIHGWVFVVLAWRSLVLAEAPTIRNGVWAGLAGILALSWTHYFLLLGGVAYAVLALLALVLGLARERSLRPVGAGAVSASLVAAFLFGIRATVGASGDDATLPYNLPSHLDETSAEPRMYLIPPANTLAGRWFDDVRAEHGLNAVEWMLYPGATMLLLGCVGLAAAAVRRGREGRAALAGALLVLAGLLFSGPPTTSLFGATIKLPAHYVYELEPSFRLYTRFVMVVMLGVSLLAAVGLAALARRGRLVGTTALVLATVLVPLDLWNRPPNPTHEIERPGVYAAAREQPPGVLAEYPLRPLSATGHYMDLYFQNEHGKPILNGYYLGAMEQRARALSDLADSRTAGWLRTLGVRYVLVTPQSLAPAAPPAGAPGRGFRLLAKDDYGSLYEVNGPERALVFHRDGFWGPEGSGTERYQWAGEPPVRLEIVAPCRQCRGRLEFVLESFDQVRTVNVRQDGRTVHFAVALTRKRLVRIPLRFERSTVLEFAIDPGPQSISETIDSADVRRISIAVQNPEFVLSP